MSLEDVGFIGPCMCVFIAMFLAMVGMVAATRERGKSPCVHCQQDAPDDARACPHCKQPLPAGWNRPPRD